MTEIERLATGKYLLVVSFRRDGRPVPTPVWVVSDQRALYIWTVRDSGKVKRIRRQPQITVAPCSLRGEPTGEAVPARAVLLDATDTERVRGLLRRKYGLSGRLTLAGSRLRRGRDGTVAIQITLDQPAGNQPG